MDVPANIERKLLTPVSDYEDHGEIDPFEDLAENTKTSYLNDASHFCYHIIGVDEPPKNESGNVIHLSLAEMGAIIQGHRISSRTIKKYLQKNGFKYKLSTINRKLASITWALNENNVPVVTKDYEVRKTMKTLKRLYAQYLAGRITPEEIQAKGFVPPERPPEELEKEPAPAARLEHLTAIIDYLDSDQCPYSNKNRTRLKALILTWWMGAFRISEIAHVRMEDIKFTREGMLITVPISKTDQEGKGITKAIPFSENPSYCPINWIRQWIERLPFPEGVSPSERRGFVFVKIFRHDVIDSKLRPLTSRAVSKKLKECASEAGLDTEVVLKGHSPRRGYVSVTWENGARGEDIRDMGWKSEVWRDYIEKSDKFKNSPSKGLL